MLVVGMTASGCSLSYPRLSFAVEQRLLRETTLDDVPDDQAETHDTVVRLMRHSPAGGACSGALIGRRHVLTAQHCVVKVDALGELTTELRKPGDMHVELGGSYLPWGRVGVREIHACEGYTQDVAHDVAVVVLSKPVPADVPLFEFAHDAPSEAGIFELSGFGSDAKPRSIPLTAWYLTSVSRHVHEGPVVGLTEGTLEVRADGAHGDGTCGGRRLARPEW